LGIIFWSKIINL